jgi:hypothetical protein
LGELKLTLSKGGRIEDKLWFELGMPMMAVRGSYHGQQRRISGGELGAVDARVE